MHQPGKQELESRILELMEDENDISTISDGYLQDLAKEDSEHPALKIFLLCVFLFVLFQLRWIPVIRDLLVDTFGEYGGILKHMWDHAIGNMPF
jgi:hypothetical protein